MSSASITKRMTRVIREGDYCQLSITTHNSLLAAIQFIYHFAANSKPKLALIKSSLFKKIIPSVRLNISQLNILPSTIILPFFGRISLRATKLMNCLAFGSLNSMWQFTVYALLPFLSCRQPWE